MVSFISSVAITIPLIIASIYGMLGGCAAAGVEIVLISITINTVNS